MYGRGSFISLAIVTRKKVHWFKQQRNSGQLGISGGKKRGKKDYPPVVVPKQLLIETTITLGVQETNV